MKRFAIICGIIAACLCVSFNASAQYVDGPIHRSGANFVDINGNILTDQQIVKVVGDDIFEKTVVGARKQFKAGKGLIWGGIAGIGVGVVGTLVSLVKMSDAGYEDIDSAVENDPAIGAMFLGSTGLVSAGCSATTAGIVLKTIGKKRLNWVEGEANAANNYTFNFGAAPSGLGLTLTF